MNMELSDDVNGLQFNMNCTNFTEADWKSLNLVRSVAAVLGTLIIFAILSFLIYYKVYSSLYQRLYFYLIIATLLSEIVGVVSIEHVWYYKGQDSVCIGVGLALVWTYVLTFIFTYEIIAHLLYLVVSKIGGTRLPQCRFKHCGVICEIVYIAIPIIIATVFALPPLIQQKYGIAGPWCFVRSLNDNCEPTGLSMQMAFYGLYMTLGVAGVVASLIFLVVYFKLAISFKEVRRLLKRTLYVLGFKFVHILMIMCSVVCRVYTLRSRRQQQYGLWLAHALAFPIGVLIFPLGYFLCFHSIGQTLRSFFKKMALKCRRSRHSTSLNCVEVLPSITIACQASVPKSDRISQPSYTFFEVLHSDTDSEESPFNKSDTGYYGSI